jgi:outer membrane protein OmpA-like peptidoglycan-associated protein
MSYLIQKGIDSNKITAKGYGEEMPIADNKSKEGRAQNRRVELKITN